MASVGTGSRPPCSRVAACPRSVCLEKLRMSKDEAPRKRGRLSARSLEWLDVVRRDRRRLKLAPMGRWSLAMRGTVAPLDSDPALATAPEDHAARPIVGDQTLKRRWNRPCARTMSARGSIGPA